MHVKIIQEFKKLLTKILKFFFKKVNDNNDYTSFKVSKLIYFETMLTFILDERIINKV